MDWGNISSRWMDWIKKYRLFLLIILIGAFLLTLPEKKVSQESEIIQSQKVQPTLEEELARILSSLEGAGRVEVLLTLAKGEEILYQIDEDCSWANQSNHTKQDTVVITGQDRAQTGLVRQRNPPLYLGAVVLCQGGNNASVRLSVVDAVSKATGLPSNKITVLKMK